MEEKAESRSILMMIGCPIRDSSAILTNPHHAQPLNYSSYSHDLVPKRVFICIEYVLYIILKDTTRFNLESPRTTLRVVEKQDFHA